MSTARAALPPGPRSLPVLGTLIDYAKDPLGFIEACVRDHGDVVYVELLGQRTYVLQRPEHIEHVLVTRHRHYIKDAFQRELMGGRLLGNGLLTNEGEPWLRQRRLMQPAFHRQRLAAYGRVMAEHARRQLATWRDGEVRDVNADMMRLTLGIVIKSLFDLELDGKAEAVGPSLARVMEHFAGVQALIFPDWLPTPENLGYRAALGQLDALVSSLIRRRREAGGGETEDLLSTLLHVQDDEGQHMSDPQIRDEVMTLMLAGHETTSINLAFCFHLLARHPEAEASLHRELDSVLGGREPTLEDLPALPFTDSVVKEALRLYPPAWTLGREALEDDEIGGWSIAKGSVMMMNPWTVHRDARLYEDPLAFRPQRWVDGLEKRLPRFAWFPFGGGPRLCIGMGFALMEARLVLATLAQRFRFERAPEDDVELLPSITLRPKHGVKVRVRTR
ncbi:cytochrome P450 [Melittangium boletus]|uniref:Cytochrome P450 n=1 Tax=Melittangium boletus DSM 14713 TaxID=1294270 RepID=A0A250IRP1_9BACT|nr:cytochrome P450 [Melittangium boletus]ATB33821.1 cytochrome P450 [Melittangium boletus DSM 14713]